jgi:nucleotidyltransferase-like protein
MLNDKVVAAADSIRAQRYAGASIVFAAGSIVRGEGTPYSDLDLVVVYPTLERAYRESFRFDGYPVEAFVHDPETLSYFFMELDRASGVPSLPQMVLEGIEIPGPSDLSRALKRRAAAVLDMGPPALSSEDERGLRYAISDLIEDLRAPRSNEELLGTGARLFEELANYHLRSKGLWSAKAKAIPRTLQRANAALHADYMQSFGTLFKHGDAGPVIKLAEEILRPAGGFLFEGYRSEAPSTWRKSWRGDSA